MGGLANAVLPDWSFSWNESYASGASFDFRSVTLRVGASRSSTCGF